MKWISLTFLSLSLLQLKAQDQYLVVGTYDSPKSEGIYVFNYNDKDGSAKPVSHIKTSNPSFLAVSANGRYVYAVNENADSTGRGGGVTAFSFDKKTGILSEINSRSSMGNHPCYISIDHSGSWLAIANYSSGNFCIYKIAEDGSIGEMTDLVQFADKANPQKQPHAHCAVFSPNNKHLLVSDLGLDKIISYEFDQRSGKVKRDIPYIVHALPGAGPRHLTFHPSGEFVYSMNEKISWVDTYGWQSGKLIALGSTTSMSKTYSGPAGSADIHVSADGKFLYASNRANANDIAVFSINKKDGSIQLIGNQATLGRTPRHFNIDPSGKYLLCGNQNSDEVVIFRRDTKSGLLADNGTRIPLGKPVCFQWIDK